MTRGHLSTWASAGLTTAALLILPGCATLREDAGLGALQTEVDARLATAERSPLLLSDTPERQQQASSEVDALLAEGPLTAEHAVRIALLNNPALRMTLFELGIADADRVQAGRLRNPGFSYGRLEGLAKSLGLTRATRFVNVLEAGVMHNTSNEAPIQRGYEIELVLPLFDWGDAKVARAEAVYMQAVENVRATASLSGPRPAASPAAGGH